MRQTTNATSIYKNLQQRNAKKKKLINKELICSPIINIINIEFKLRQ